MLGEIIGLASAGLGLYGASQSASAQKKAAEEAARLQAESTQKQIDLARQIYNQNRLDYTPYRTLGAYAASRLGKRIGMPEGYDPSPINYVAGQVPQATQQAAAAGSQGLTAAQMFLQKLGIPLNGSR